MEIVFLLLGFLYSSSIMMRLGSLWDDGIDDLEAERYVGREGHGGSVDVWDCALKIKKLSSQVTPGFLFGCLFFRFLGRKKGSPGLYVSCAQNANWKN